MKKFNAVVIGLGLMGMRYGFDSKREQPASHISAILQNEKLNLVGVSDPAISATKLFLNKYGKKYLVFNNYTELIDYFNKRRIALHLISIATPDETHFKILKYILKNLRVESKLIVFCEKPITIDLVHAKEIKHLLKNPKIKIVVNHIRRWSKLWQEAYLLSKKIGKIEKAVFFFSTSPENKNIIQIRDGIHIADLINWFKIEGKVSVNRLMLPYFIIDFYLWGSKGKIEVLNYHQVLNFYKTKESDRFTGFKELQLSYSKKIRESLTANAYEEFVEFLEEKRISLSTDIDDAISALKVFKEYVYDSKISNN
jgi:hypothetical protein